MRVSCCSSTLGSRAALALQARKQPFERQSCSRSDGHPPVETSPSIESFCLSHPDSSLIYRVSFSLVGLLGPLFPGTFTSLQPKAILSESGQLLLSDVENLFLYVVRLSRLDVGELLHSLFLFDLLTQAATAYSNKYSTPYPFSTGNLGTVVLCCVILAQKMNRDHPYSDRWWASAVGINLSIISQSELVVLQLLDFNLMMRDQELKDLVEFFR